VSRLSRQWGIPNISQPYRPPRPVTGIALIFLLLIYSWAEVPQNSRPYFTVSCETPPTWEAKFSPRNKVAQLYPRALGSLSVASYNSRGLRWRYSNPPPHGVQLSLEVEVEVNLRPTVSRPTCPGVRRPSGTCDQFFFRHEISCRQLRLCYFVAPSWSWSSSCGWQSVNQFAWVSGLPLGPMTRCYLALLFRLTITLFFVRRRPLWRENGSVVHSAHTL
jgi:hypothetical protein